MNRLDRLFLIFIGVMWGATVVMLADQLDPSTTTDMLFLTMDVVMFTFWSVIIAIVLSRPDR